LQNLVRAEEGIVFRFSRLCGRADGKFGLCAAEGAGVAENLHPVSGRVKRFPDRFWQALTESGSTDS